MEESLSNREIFLEQLKSGDESSKKPFAESLIESLLYVPTVVETVEEDSNGLIKINAITVQGNGKTMLPVFSSKALFSDWCTAQEDFFNSISVFGGDIADVLADDMLVLLDPGAEQEYLIEGEILDIMKSDSVVETGEVSATEEPQEEFDTLDPESEAELMTAGEDGEMSHDIDMDLAEDAVIEEIVEASAEEVQAQPETDVVELTVTLDEFLADTASEVEQDSQNEPEGDESVEGLESKEL